MKNIIVKPGDGIFPFWFDLEDENENILFSKGARSLPVFHNNCLEEGYLEITEGYTIQSFDETEEGMKAVVLGR